MSLVDLDVCPDRSFIALSFDNQLWHGSPDASQWRSHSLPSSEQMMATACAPAEHGVLGHMLWFEEVGAVVNMLTLYPVGGDTPISEDIVRRVPTVYERLAAACVPSTLITDFAFEGTPFTNLLTAKPKSKQPTTPTSGFLTFRAPPPWPAIRKTTSSANGKPVRPRPSGTSRRSGTTSDAKSTSPSTCLSDSSAPPGAERSLKPGRARKKSRAYPA